MVATRLEPPVGENDRVRSPADAPLTLVEHGDYDSPYTARAFFAGRFERELADHARALSEQLRSGLASGVRGTPAPTGWKTWRPRFGGSG